MKIELTGTPEDLATFLKTSEPGRFDQVSISPEAAEIMRLMRNYSASRTAERVMAGINQKIKEENEFFDGKAESKYKPGDKVKVVANTCNHDIPLGTLCEVGRYCDVADCLDCEITPINGGRKMWAHPADIEPYVEPQKTEPIKLYCVKSFSYCSDTYLIKGKTYVFENGKLNHEQSVHNEHASYEEFAKYNKSMSACLVPLVKREANVGEWAYDTTYKKVFRVCEVGKNTVDTDEYGSWLGHDEYLVLDNYRGDRP